ncbi:potassium-transporting ATPase subunit KdpC [Streptomyces sp. NPDC020403]|uniref:potassium-transporting ATPase subunit KdpC n=1 Tax=unclassified Streptomyces TaxID=2593676 RepID=UPI00340EC5CE
MSRPLGPVLRQHLAALRMLLVFTVVTGLAYPLAVTGIAQVAFPHHANGSLIDTGGRPVASGLIGQSFPLLQNGEGTGRPDPKWFQPRPSTSSYDPLASGASNLGPNNPTLVARAKERRAALSAFDGVPPGDVPADALTASGSGLDPDISPAYAYEQVDRVARARGLPRSTVRGLVTAHRQRRALGFLGQEHVNTVQLNHALARLG